MNSRPCMHCLTEIKKYDIRRVYYSDTDGSIVYESAAKMTSTHASKGNRKKV
jgi:hypothetical protein